MRILLVCPHEGRCRQLVDRFRALNLEMETAHDTDEAVGILEDRGFAAVLLDGEALNHSVSKGVSRIRQEGFEESVIVFDIGAESKETLACLDAGADDVTPTQMDAEELIARIRAVIRRCTPHGNCRYTMANLHVDVTRHSVTRNDTPIRMTGRELAMLEHMMLNPRRIVTRQELADRVWHRDLDPESNIIETFMARLRRKIDRDYDPKLLHTVKGRGYMISETPPGETT